MITSKYVSVIGLAGLLSLVWTQGCSSDSTPPTPLPGSSGAAAAGAVGTGVSGGGSAGAPTFGGAPAGGSDLGGGGATTGGGGSDTGGGGSGATAGTGGSSGGSTGGSSGAGGGTAGAAGSSAGAGGGGSTVPFSQIKTLFSTSCGVGACHNAASKNLDYQGTMDLHALLTTAIPTGIAHCVGSTLVTAGNANSWLLAVVKGGTACPTGGGNIAKMPLGCTNNCLTTAQIKTISDWIAEGAPAM